MTTDFELQRRLRDLRAPVTPERDLFPGIAAHILARQRSDARAPRRLHWLFAAAAAVVVSVVTAVGVGEMASRRVDSDPVSHSIDPATLPGMNAAALAGAPGGDPRLAAATLEVEAARVQLERAIAERPDAVFLVSVMNRANAQQMKLERLGSNAG